MRLRDQLSEMRDVILRTALGFGADAIDLRLVCTTRTDFANPIEPSGPGGRKIAQAIAVALGANGGRTRPCRLTAG